MHEKPVVIGVDLGGTRLRGGVVTPKGEILFRDARWSHAGKSQKEALDSLFGLIGPLKDAASEDGLRVFAIGIGCPGPVDVKAGLILKPPNCPALEGLNLKERLEERFGLPVRITKDVSASSLGEAWKGVAIGHERFVMLTLGTGVGGAVMTGGRPLDDSLGMATEIGHMTLYPKGARCGCGNFGCAEVYLSARGLLNRALPLLERDGAIKGQRRERLFVRLQEMSRASDPGFMGVLKGFGEDLGLLLASVVNLFHPEIVVVGGGLTVFWDGFIGPARKTLKRRAMPSLVEGLKVLKSKLGDDAGILGSARLALCSVGLRPDGGTGQDGGLDPRPWGVGEVLVQGMGYKVKRLCVLPNSRLSYQRHFFRDEVWAVVSAKEAFFTLEGERRPLKVGDSVVIPKGHLHRLENASLDTELVLIETQIGTRLLESDIERVEDDYGRIGE